MYLVIAEKPSVSRSIAEVLGAKERKDGYLEGDACIVSWCLGHLAEYMMPDGYDEKYSRWLYDDLPIIPKEWKLLVSEEKKDQFYILKQLLNRPDIAYVVNGCDAGREGELIFRRVYDLSGSSKPVKRLWISSMEDAAIREGMEHLRSGQDYKNLADAAVCRAQADWLVGMNATRAYTTRYGKRLTVGRVQTPTLAMLAERAGEISRFKKTKYFNVELDCGGMKAVKQKIFDPEEAKRLQETCNGSDAVVVSVTSEDKKISPPRLYDLTTLQREANRIYGMTAQQTLTAAQSLYEQKLITYPRTDSNFLTEDMEQTARNVIRAIHEKYHPMGPFDQPAKPDIARVLNNRKVSDHHAIIPTIEIRDADLGSLRSPEQDILFLISIHMIQATEQEHLYTETSVDVECQGEHFAAKGKRIRQPGWKLYDACFKNPDRVAIEDPDAETKEQIPDVKEGQVFCHVDAARTEHFTSPPKNYTEDTLLAAMETAGNKEFDENTEKKGLGTPATRAGIIEKLVSSKYAVRKGKQILPTEDGKVLIEIMPEFLKSAGMTAEWENQLLEMESGKITPERFMEGIKNLISMMLDECDLIPEEETNRFRARESLGTCPVCGSLVYEGKDNYYCSSRDCRFVLWKETRYLKNMRKTIDKNMAVELLKNGSVYIRDLYSAKKGSCFEAELVMKAEDGKVIFSLTFPNKKQARKENNKKKKG